jgi:hypothetical protein
MGHTTAVSQPESQRPVVAGDVFAPEYYADQLQIGSNPWGFIFQFGLVSEGGSRPVATVRMSPQHAKVMALLLKRVLTDWEEKMGTMDFPEELRRELNLPDDL